jgi:hypothetical protein
VPVFIVGMAYLAVSLGGLAYVACNVYWRLIDGLARRVSTSREGDPAPRLFSLL